MTTEDTYKLWLDRLDSTDPLYRELLAIREDPAEINDRFYTTIVFGTAGLRGICGAGTNRMNRLTVGRASRGIADYILASGEDASRGVVIAYDCRHFSREFSELAAGILAGRGIPVYLFPSLRPTPELSFAIRRLGALSGINMTASHNPKEYNGYKVYWADGAQISGNVSDGMQAAIEALDFFDDFGGISLEEARRAGLVTMLGEEMDRSYQDYVMSLSVRDGDELDKSIGIVYTPLNGAGSRPLTAIAEARGFTGFVVVSEQRDPDPDFTTVPYPNPENPAAFALAESLGKSIGAEVLIATDPDSDRMAVEIRTEDGGFRFLNGNQTGALLIAYLAQARRDRGELQGRQAMIKSIVTGDFGRAICEDYGIEVYETLTGFKNICGRIDELKAEGCRYFFGYEESIGCAPGEEVRDKDGISAAMLVLEMAAWCRRRGTTLGGLLEDLWRQYGWFAEDQVSLVLTGQEGSARISRIMEAFRKEAPSAFGGTAVSAVIDYRDGYRDIPPQNAMTFILADGTRFSLRPSGTEPKLKFYFYTSASSRSEAGCRMTAVRDAVTAMADGVR